MEDSYNQTMSSLLFLQGANSWYIEGDLNFPVLPPQKKIIYPAVPNNRPILPSGEYAKPNPPPAIPTQENGSDEEDEYEISDEEDMELEETMDQNDGVPIVQPPVIRLDSCGREVEDYTGLSSDEEETPEQNMASDERSSSQVACGSSLQNRSSVTKTVENASTSSQSTGMIHRQYCPVSSDSANETAERQTTSKRKKFVTTDVRIDHFNGMMKYTFFKKPVEVSSDEEDTDEQNVPVRNLFSQKVSYDIDEHSDSSHDQNGSRVNEQINGSVIEGNPWISFGGLYTFVLVRPVHKIL